MALADQIKWDKPLDAVSPDLARRRSAACCRARSS